MSGLRGLDDQVAIVTGGAGGIGAHPRARSWQ